MQQPSVEHIADAARKLLPKMAKLPEALEENVHEDMDQLIKLLSSVLGAQNVNLPPEATRELTGIVKLLAALVATKFTAQHSNHLLAASISTCPLLTCLVRLAATGLLALQEADALRLLSAATLPLQIVPRLLRTELQHIQLTVPPHVAALQELIGSSSETLETVVYAASNPDSALPARARAAALASTLRPQVLAAWVETMSDLAVKAVAHLGAAWLPTNLLDTLMSVIGLTTDDDQPVLPALPTPRQVDIVQLAAASLAAAMQPAAAGSGWCWRKRCCLRIAGDINLTAGRQQYELDTGGSLMAQVLQVLQPLLPELGEDAAADEPSSLGHGVLICLQMLAMLFRDVATHRDWQRCQAALPQLLLALQGMHRLLIAVAAAAPPASSSSPATSTAALLWRNFELAQAFGNACLAWVLAFDAFGQRVSEERIFGSQAAQAAAAALEALLFLALLLPQQPLLLLFGSVEVAAIVPAGKARACDLAETDGNLPQLLAAAAHGLAATLIRWVPSGFLPPEGTCPQSPNEPDAPPDALALALAAFQAAVAACKHEWASAAAANFWTDQQRLEIPSPMLTACSVAASLIATLRRPCSMDVQRYLDCLALTYLEALEAHPAVSPNEEPLLMGMAVLRNLYCVSHAGSLMLQDANLSSKASSQLVKLATAALSDSESYNVEKAGWCTSMLQQAAQADPAVLVKLAAEPGLLQGMAKLAAWVCSNPSGSSSAELEKPLQALLSHLVGHLKHQASAAPASATEPAAPAALHQCSLDEMPLAELAQVLTQLCDSQISTGGSGNHPAPALPPAPPELVVRRAQALALRSCANPRCANLAGAGEAALKGRRCGGCGIVRYCSEACSHADWRAHKPACRLLRQQQKQEQGQKAGSSSSSSTAQR